MYTSLMKYSSNYLVLISKVTAKSSCPFLLSLPTKWSRVGSHGPPQNLMAEAASSRALLVSWNPPASEPDHYQVGWESVNIVIYDDTSCTIEDLTPCESYIITVQSVYEDDVRCPTTVFGTTDAEGKILNLCCYWFMSLLIELVRLLWSVTRWYSDATLMIPTFLHYYYQIYIFWSHKYKESTIFFLLFWTFKATEERYISWTNWCICFVYSSTSTAVLPVHRHKNQRSVCGVEQARHSLCPH